MDNRLSSNQKTKPCWGERVCDDRGWSFDDVFRHQFRIASTPAVSSKNWERIRFSDYSIEHCRCLPITEIRSRRGALLGYCLGIGVTQAGQVVGAPDGDPLVISAAFSAVERLQRRLAGRFVLFCEIEGEARVYPDATCSLAFVTNSSECVVAATTGLALRDPMRTLDRSTDEKRLRNATLMGDARDPRLVQAIGNHFVRLPDLTAQRFWPTLESNLSHFTDAEGSAVAVQIAERLRKIVECLVQTFETTIPLTGGSDSRMLVAASLTAKDSVADYYVHEINWASTFDVLSAIDVSEFLGISLAVNSLLPGKLDSLDGWDEVEEREKTALSTGYAVTNIDRGVSASFFGLPNNPLLLRGGGGEVARASRWPRPLTRGVPDADRCFDQFTRMTKEAIVQSLGQSAAADLRQKYQNWLDALPLQARATAYDLAHIELWQSQADRGYYASRSAFFVNPFGELSLLHKMMRYDPHFRKSHRLVNAILEHFATGLSKRPFSRKLRRENRERNAE